MFFFPCFFVVLVYKVLLELIPGCVYGSVLFPPFSSDLYLTFVWRDFICGLREVFDMAESLGTNRSLFLSRRLSIR